MGSRIMPYVDVFDYLTLLEALEKDYPALFLSYENSKIIGDGLERLNRYKFETGEQPPKELQYTYHFKILNELIKEHNLRGSAVSYRFHIDYIREKLDTNDISLARWFFISAKNDEDIRVFITMKFGLDKLNNSRLKGFDY